jgi:hypothetical protein
MNVAGSSVLLGPTATSLMDHLRMGKPSLAGGRSFRICCEVNSVHLRGKYRLGNEFDCALILLVSRGLKDADDKTNSGMEEDVLYSTFCLGAANRCLDFAEAGRSTAPNFEWLQIWL